MLSTGPEPCPCDCGSSFMFTVEGNAAPSSADRLSGECLNTGRTIVLSGIRAWTSFPLPPDVRVVPVK